MKNTALTHIHESLGAKMVPFAGYNMPVQYEGVTAEHETVRNSVGVFDVSHMGEFLLEGPNALALIQKVTSNDAAVLTNGRAQYSCLPNENGGIVDDLIVYKFNDEKYLLVVNASNIEKDWNWISSHNTVGASMKNLSDDYSLLAIQGPKAVEAMQSLTSIDLSAINYYHFEVADFAGIEHVIISATGYTGSGGFEIYCKNSEVEQVWTKVFEAGAAFGIKPIGLAARDTLRLEMGFCLYGNDINDTTSPLEAGLGWITKFTKEFTNSENLKNLCSFSNSTFTNISASFPVRGSIHGLSFHANLPILPWTSTLSPIFIMLLFNGFYFIPIHIFHLFIKRKIIINPNKDREYSHCYY
jgi:aminomethyltransferase